MTTSTTRAAELMAADFAAVAARDIETFATFLHDGTTEVLHALDLVLVGREAIVPVFREIFTALPDMRFVTEAIHGVDDRTAVGQWHLTGTFTGGPFQGIEPTGRAIDLQGVDVMRFDADGRLDHNDVYYDGLAFARQVGLLPTADSIGDRGLLAAFNGLTRLRSAVRRRLGS